jgi:DNA-binding beta-propeller fold protein YncE
MNSRGNELLSCGARALTVAIAGFLAVLMLALLASPALADTEIGSPGTGAGETKDPRGVAVDEATDLLYVADRGNNRIDVFDVSTGEFVKAFGWGVLDGSNELQVCTTTCLPGLAGSGAGQLSGALGIAVDNDSTSPGFHSVYVFDVGNRRVQKFTPDGQFVWMVGGAVNVTTGGDLCTATSGDTCGPGTGGEAAGQFNAPEGDTIEVGPGGTVYVGDRVTDGGIQKTRVQMYDPAGSYLGYYGGKLLEVTGGAGGTTALAVDSGGNIYVGTAGERGAVRKYNSSGNEVVAFNQSFNVNTVAVGPEDHVFVGDNAQWEGEVVSTILEYDSSGNLLRKFYGSLVERTFGLDVYPNPNGDIIAVELGELENKKILNIEFPPPGPLVYAKPSTLFAGPIGNTKATLNGKVNPEGEATTYYFEYISDEDFVAAGNTFGEGTIKTPVSGPLPADFDLHPVQANVQGLAAETTYHFRIVVMSAATGPDGNTSPTVTFTTKQPLEFGDVWSSGVGVTTATLHGEVNPLGIPATARFEYVELAKYEESEYAEAQQVPGPSEEEIDLGEGEEMKEVSAQISGLKAGTTYRYRIVATDRCKPEPAPLCVFFEPEGTFTTFVALSPIKGCPNDALRAGGSGTFLPDCRGYEMVSPVDKNGAFIEPVFNVNGFPAGLDQAAVGGDSVTFSAYKAFGDVASAPYTNQYLARRGGGGWETEAISPEREGPSLMTFESAQLDRQYKAFSADLCTGWVVQDANPALAPEAIEGFPGLYQRDNCGPGTGGYETVTRTEPAGGEPPNLPAQKFIPELQGTSEDGEVAIFSVDDNLATGMPAQPASCETSGSGCLGRIYESRGTELNYVCVLPDETPHAGSCSAGTPGGAGAAERGGSMNNAISSDGSRIFWSASDEGPAPLYVRIDRTETVQISSASAFFWTAAADGSKAIYSVGDKLFEYDVDAEDENLIAEGVIGVAGASEDASRIYLASSKVLTGAEENSEGAKAEAGKTNLYLYEAGAGFEFIGILPTADSEAGEASPIATRPNRRLSRVTPDGNHLTFMSRGSLTGYDNRDAASKQPDYEVYLYDATSDELACASCNPSGARPEGRQLTQKLLENRWAAARIPVWTSQLYGNRVISDDGERLYFNSFEALVSTDTNGKEDVYQWQAPGSGSCTTSGPTYQETSGGCVDLISSGKSPQDSELVDISTDGRDVFFKTTQSLVTQDPGLRDIYDARIEGGFPPLPPKPIICQGEACPNPPPPAPPAVVPASQAQGPGNPVWPKPKPKARKCPKGKHKVKKNGKVRCVKNKRGKQQGKKRANNNRRAAR